MENAFDAVTQAIRQARDLNAALNRSANTLADMLDTQLESVSDYRLKLLKAKLARYNSQTKRWKR